MSYKRLIIPILLFWHLLLNIIFPYPNLDGPWSLSHTFSILNGMPFKSTFAHEYFEFYNLPYVFGLINAIFYFPFAHSSFVIYSIFIVNLIFISSCVFLIIKIFGKISENRNLAYYLSLSLILSLATYLQRPELFNMVLLLILHMVLSSNAFRMHTKKILLSGALLAIIALSHPAGGIYAVYYFTVYCYDNRDQVKVKHWLITGLVALLTCLILYLPVLAVGYSRLKENIFQHFFVNESHVPDLSYLSEFLFYSVPFIPLIFIYFFTLQKEKIWREMLIWLGAIAVTSIFGRYYYYFYLVHFLVCRFSALEVPVLQKCKSKLIFLFLAAGCFQTFIFPTFQVIENYQYTTTFKNVLLKSREIGTNNPGRKVWASPFNAMSVIDLPNGRLYYANYVASAGKKPLLNGDVFLFEHWSLFQNIKSIASQNDSLLVKNIIPEVTGLRRFAYPWQRSESLGLWQVTIQKKK